MGSRQAGWEGAAGPQPTAERPTRQQPWSSCCLNSMTLPSQPTVPSLCAQGELTLIVLHNMLQAFLHVRTVGGEKNVIRIMQLRINCCKPNAIVLLSKEKLM